jgi:hypothetical protein
MPRQPRFREITLSRKGSGVSCRSPLVADRETDPASASLVMADLNEHHLAIAGTRMVGQRFKSDGRQRNAPLFNSGQFTR